jgi:hypothetical protein
MRNCLLGGCFPGGEWEGPEIDWNSPETKKNVELIRKSMPNLIAREICDVQPLLESTSLIFTMGASKPLSFKERILRNIRIMKMKPSPQAYDRVPKGWRRELDVRKQVDCIEIVRDELDKRQ